MTFNGRYQGLAAVAALAMALGVAAPAMAGNIIDDWKTVHAPKAPELKKVTVNARDTALIIMDMQTTSCVPKHRPRCVDTIPHVEDLQTRARAAGMVVVKTYTSSASVDKILPQFAPKDGEVVFSSTVDKFHGSNLEKMLKDKGINTVIIVGTSAEGAVLGTLIGAAVRGFKVIVPVDGMSSDNPYAEQYVAYEVVHSPGTRKVATLTKASLITIK